MDVTGQFHAQTALSPGQLPLVTTGQEAGWTPEPAWMLWKREKSCPSWELIPRRPARSLSLYRLSSRVLYFSKPVEEWEVYLNTRAYTKLHHVVYKEFYK